MECATNSTPFAVSLCRILSILLHALHYFTKPFVYAIRIPLEFTSTSCLLAWAFSALLLNAYILYIYLFLLCLAHFSTHSSNIYLFSTVRLYNFIQRSLDALLPPFWTPAWPATFFLSWLLWDSWLTGLSCGCRCDCCWLYGLVQVRLQWLHSSNQHSASSPQILYSFLWNCWEPILESYSVPHSPQLSSFVVQHFRLHFQLFPLLVAFNRFAVCATSDAAAAKANNGVIVVPTGNRSRAHTHMRATKCCAASCIDSQFTVLLFTHTVDPPSDL